LEDTVHLQGIRVSVKTIIPENRLSFNSFHVVRERSTDFSHTHMICAKMDAQLLRLAQRHRCIYTRYADDITFSTSMPSFPTAIARINSAGQMEAGNELVQIITENGFEINPRKVRLRTRNQRQEVTGLIVNEFINVPRRFIRQIRAMLHAWEEYGLDAAQEEFRTKYDRKHRSPDRKPPSFARVVKGKIDYLGMVRGKHDRIYQRFLDQLGRLVPELVGETENAVTGQQTALRPQVLTEGITDVKHLKAALAWLQAQGRFAELDPQLQEPEHKMGDTELLHACRGLSKTEGHGTVICISMSLS
jgi:RNA-directed DNA polymerase